MSKSAVIRHLYAKGCYSVAEIAATAGCRPEYVRTVARQRKGSVSETDRRYRESSRGKALRQRQAPKRRAYASAWGHEMRLSGDREIARQKGREAAAKVVLA